MYTQKHLYFHTSFVHFPHKKQIRRRAQPLFPKVPIFIMDLLEKPQVGLGFKEADFTLFGATHPWQFTKGTPGTQVGPSRRGEKKYGSLNLSIIHKGISFSKYFHTWSFTRFLADFSPAATELRQAVRQRGRRYFDPAPTGSVTLPKTVTRASPQQVLRGPQLLAWWSGRLGFFPP